jgi:ubiquitin-activating enzyme E1
MVFFKAPVATLSLLALSFLPSASMTLSLAPTPAARLDNFDRLKLALAKRQECAGIQCGFYNQLCCTGGAQCGTDTQTQAICIPPGDGWSYNTYYYTQAETITKASTWSTYIGANPTGSACNSRDVCGSACCGSGEWCNPKGNVCQVIGGGSAGSLGGSGTGTNPSAPVRPTSNGVIVITATGSATATVPFTTPIPTGVNGTLVEENSGGGGLSGGAIAGIVIGVIAGIILLLLICFYCCAKAAFDGILAIIGLGKRKKKHTHEETTYIEEHHSGAAAGGRRWYGQAGSARPSRPPKKDGGGLGKMLGIGAGVAGLAALMGMKKKNDRKHHDDKSTTVTDSSYYYSDYTSTSEFASLHN